MITDEDSKYYEEREMQYQKLISQRLSLDNINPSQAHRHIQ